MRLQLLSTTSNAARRVNFLLQIWLSGGFSRRFAKTYDYPPFPAPAQTSPRPRIRESLAPILPSTAAVGTLWLGAALARDERAAGNAVAAIPQNVSQGAGIRPGDRNGAAAAPQWSLPSAPPH